ncbi:hypothetical protein ACH5RR_011243 [Cinchona calisaya]|uniref:Uncharacterized protein n=1 Tax=Cinchona calisaya TaxID=153742 RepID=A0ABD3A4C0_9GENT
MLQRQILFKQLQEMQHQQQLQELSDARQQNCVNQPSYLNKQTSVGLHPPLINGMPVDDASQMFMVANTQLMQLGTSPTIQGIPNGLVFPQAQNETICSNGVRLQQFDASLYGMPIASSGNNMNPYSCIQGASHDSSNMLNRGNNSQLEIPVMQPSTVSNSFANQQFNAPPHEACNSDGNFVPKNVYEDNNMFRQHAMQALYDGDLPANFQQPHSLQRNTAANHFVMRQEQAGWPELSAGKTSNVRPSQCATSLDPLEEKILFNTDDNSWESSLGRQSNGGLSGFASTGEHVDFMGTFSLNQSGSWSALMQSAVAEAPSSDTGQQEEWSRLTFQKPELSSDYQHYIGDGKESSWVNSNLKSICSPTSKPEVLFQSSSTNYSFPTSQESDHHVVRQKEGRHSSHESVQQSPKNASKWFDSNLQPKQTVEGCQLVQTSHPLQNACHNQQSDSSKNDGRQPSISPYTVSSQSSNILTGHELKANEWLHESGPQPMVGDRQRPPDQVGYNAFSKGFSLRLSASQQMPKSYYSLGSSVLANTSVPNASVPLYQNNQLKDQHHTVTPVANQSPHATLPAITGTFRGQECPTLETLPITQTLSISGVPQQIELLKGPPNMSQDVHHLSGANAITSDSVITTKHHLAFDTVDQRDNTPNTARRDLDAFGSSPTSHVLQQNFPLLHQQLNANTRQQLFYGLKSGVTNLAQGDPNAKSQLKSISSWDIKSMTYSSEAGGNQPGTHSSKAFTQDMGMLKFGEYDTHSHSKEQSQINAQMVPSWNGTMMNGQMLPVYDLMCQKEAVRQFSDGKSFENFQVISSNGQVNSSNASHLSSILPNSATKIVANQLLSPFLMPSDPTERNLAVLRSKKRKVSAFYLLPWHKEVTQTPQKLQKVSSAAESEWTIASNRLSERVDNGAEMMEDALPMSRAKIRLVLTTQLMQQVFRPAPAAILSADAWSNSESMVYFVARLALGDACCMTSDFQKTFLTNDMSSKNLGTSDGVGRLDLPEAVQNFIDQAQRLENDLLRLDKTASIVDIKVDSQELERFSVINRFAKFHSRGHLISVNASSTSGANPAVLKASPQRYVVAHPMPKVVPEGINCISL